MSKESQGKKAVNGNNMVYHIIQKKIVQACDVDNPSDEVKFMIEQLLLWGGIWFRPETFEQIPVLRPYAIRDSSCRKKNPATGKHSWALSNDRGLMRDDNTSIKDIPDSLAIHSSLPELKGMKLKDTTGFVASHVWIKLKTRAEHACEWECTNSFIPNLVWLPEQLSKLTDRDGSYAQLFLKHLSYQLYGGINPAHSMLSGIWAELENPGIKPVSIYSLDDLNYFEHRIDWVTRKRNILSHELHSIIDILNNPHAVITGVIYNQRYTDSLRGVSGTMGHSDKSYLRNWIWDNLTYLGSSSFITVVGHSPRTPSTKPTAKKAFGKAAILPPSSSVAKSPTSHYRIYDATGTSIGSTSSANEVPLIIVRDYCSKNKGVTYSDLNRIFNVVKCYHMSRYPGMIIPKMDVDSYEADLIVMGKKPDTRVHKDSITLASGDVVFVTNQWIATPGGNFSVFIDLAKKLGYIIV